MVEEVDLKENVLRMLKRPTRQDRLVLWSVKGNEETLWGTSAWMSIPIRREIMTEEAWCRLDFFKLIKTGTTVFFLRMFVSE